MQKKKYRHLFFDLDHTLWDFERNSRETLHELYAAFRLKEHGVTSADEFIEVYMQINYSMWDLYHRNQIDRETLRTIRFKKTFEYFNVRSQSLSNQFPDAYLDLLPDKKNLFPGAIEILSLLEQNHSLHLITNGFAAVQKRKIEASGLRKFFQHLIISEETGFKKPEKEIFQMALGKSGASAGESIMIGDDAEADIKGAIHAGWDSVFFNPQQKTIDYKATFEISSLHELKSLFTGS